MPDVIQHLPRTRPWGIEYPITITDSGQPDVNVLLLFHGEPTEAELSARIVAAQQRIADELATAELEANMAEVLE